MLPFVRTRLTRVAVLLVVAALPAASSVFVASAWSARTKRVVHFVLPGGDTECQMVDPNTLIGNVTCGIHRNRFRCVPRGCDEESRCSRRWSVELYRFAEVTRSCRPLGSDRPRVLRPGRSLTFTYFRCTSRAAGLTCVSRYSGHGFFLSKNNKSQRLL
jgi:hypothetical protein